MKKTISKELTLKDNSSLNKFLAFDNKETVISDVDKALLADLKTQHDYFQSSNQKEKAEITSKAYELVLHDITVSNKSAISSIQSVLKKQEFNNKLSKNLLTPYLDKNKYKKKVILKPVNSNLMKTSFFVLFAALVSIAIFSTGIISSALVGIFIILTVINSWQLGSGKAFQFLGVEDHCNKLLEKNNRLELTRRNANHSYLRENNNTITFNQYAVSVKEIKITSNNDMSKDKASVDGFEVALIKYRPTANSYTIKKTKVKNFAKENYESAIEYKLELEEIAEELETKAKENYDNLEYNLLEVKNHEAQKLLDQTIEQAEHKALLENLRGY